MQPTADTNGKKLTALGGDQLCALDHYVDRLCSAPSLNLTQAVAILSEPAFAAVWDNSEDAAYDEL